MAKRFSISLLFVWTLCMQWTRGQDQQNTLPVHITEGLIDENLPRPTEDEIETTLLGAVALRNNLIKLLGATLEHPHLQLKDTEWTAIEELYSGLRRKAINTIDVVGNMQNLFQKSLQEQVIGVVMRLENTVSCRYVCHVRALRNTLQKLDFDAMMRGLNISVVRNVPSLKQESLNYPWFSMLSDKIHSKDQCNKQSVFLTSILEAIKKKYISLTARIFALLLLNIELPGTTSYGAEKVRFVAESLLKNDYSTLDKELFNINVTEYSDLYSLLRDGLLIISESKCVMKHHVKFMAESAASHIMKDALRYSIKGSHDGSKIYDNGGINFEELFKVFESLNFPQDVEDSAGLLLKDIKKEKLLKMTELDQQLLYYNNDDSLSILIVLLQRLRFALPTSSMKLPIVKSILTHLHFKQCQQNGHNCSPKSSDDLIRMVDSFSTLSLDANSAQLMTNLVTTFSKKDLQKTLTSTELPYVLCKSPRLMLMYLIQKLMTLNNAFDKDEQCQLEKFSRNFVVVGDDVVIPRILNATHVDIPLEDEKPKCLAKCLRHAQDDYDDASSMKSEVLKIPPLKFTRKTSDQRVVHQSFRSKLQIRDSVITRAKKVDFDELALAIGEHAPAESVAYLRQFFNRPETPRLLQDFEFKRYFKKGELLQALVSYFRDKMDEPKLQSAINKVIPFIDKSGAETQEFHVKDVYLKTVPREKYQGETLTSLFSKIHDKCLNVKEESLLKEILSYYGGICITRTSTLRCVSCQQNTDQPWKTVVKQQPWKQMPWEYDTVPWNFGLNVNFSLSGLIPVFRKRPSGIEKLVYSPEDNVTPRSKKELLNFYSTPSGSYSKRHNFRQVINDASRKLTPDVYQKPIESIYNYVIRPLRNKPFWTHKRTTSTTAIPKVCNENKTLERQDQVKITTDVSTKFAVIGTDRLESSAKTVLNMKSTTPALRPIHPTMELSETQYSELFNATQYIPDSLFFAMFSKPNASLKSIPYKVTQKELTRRPRSEAPSSIYILNQRKPVNLPTSETLSAHKIPLNKYNSQDYSWESIVKPSKTTTSRKIDVQLLPPTLFPIVTDNLTYPEDTTKHNPDNSKSLSTPQFTRLSNTTTRNIQDAYHLPTISEVRLPKSADMSSTHSPVRNSKAQTKISPTPLEIDKILSKANSLNGPRHKLVSNYIRPLTKGKDGIIDTFKKYAYAIYHSIDNPSLKPGRKKSTSRSAESSSLVSFPTWTKGGKYSVGAPGVDTLPISDISGATTMPVTSNTYEINANKVSRVEMNPSTYGMTTEYSTGDRSRKFSKSPSTKSTPTLYSLPPNHHIVSVTLKPSKLRNPTPTKLRPSINVRLKPKKHSSLHIPHISPVASRHPSIIQASKRVVKTSSEAGPSQHATPYAKRLPSLFASISKRTPTNTKTITITPKASIFPSMSIPIPNSTVQLQKQGVLEVNNFITNNEGTPITTPNIPMYWNPFTERPITTLTTNMTLSKIKFPYINIATNDTDTLKITQRPLEIMSNNTHIENFYKKIKRYNSTSGKYNFIKSQQLWNQGTPSYNSLIPINSALHYTPMIPRYSFMFRNKHSKVDATTLGLPKSTMASITTPRVPYSLHTYPTSPVIIDKCEETVSNILTVSSTNFDIMDTLKAIPRHGLTENARNSVLKLYNLFSNKLTKFSDYIQGFPIENYHTRGTFLKDLLKYLLDNPQVPVDIKDVIQGVIPYVQLDGPGLKPVDLINVDTHYFRQTDITTSMVAVDISNMFDQLQKSVPNPTDVETILKFLSSEESNIEKFTSTFDFERFRTKRTFLTAFLEHLKAMGHISQNVMKAISNVMPYVSTSFERGEVVTFTQYRDVAENML